MKQACNVIMDKNFLLDSIEPVNLIGGQGDNRCYTTSISHCHKTPVPIWVYIALKCPHGIKQILSLSSLVENYPQFQVKSKALVGSK